MKRTKKIPGENREIAPNESGQEMNGETILSAISASVIKDLSSGLIVTDGIARIIFANSAAESILGYTVGDLNGLDIGDIFLSDEHQPHPVIQALQVGKTYKSIELPACKKDGSRALIGLSVSLHKDSLGQRIGTICIFKDLSDIKNFESILIQSSRMAGIGILAAGIAHEFNNLIGGMMGYAQLAQMTKSLEDYEQCVDVVIKSSRRAKEITSGLLQFSRRDPGKMEQARLIDVIQETLALMKRVMEKKQITLLLDVDGSITLTTAIGKLQQVLLCLIQNATDAMPKGGNLTFLAREENDHVIIQVTDTGIGIPKEDLNKIFYPFFSTKGSIGESSTMPGSGLGLAVTYGIIQSLSGSIAVESDEGRGSRFTITIPRELTGIHPIVSPKTPAIAREKVSNSTISGHILVIDDEDVMTSMLKKCLEFDNHTVEVAQDGYRGIDIAKSKPIDLAVVDIAMPGLNGWQTLTQLKQIKKNMSSIVITGNAAGSGPEDPLFSNFIQKIEEVGVDSYLLKPFDLKEIKRMVSTLLAKK